MDSQLVGLHHVTAIAGDPQANVDFYVGVLGLRLVKQTVNFDDPFTYHLYYGDDLGRPGTILTFFPWPGAPRGRQGTGLTTAAAFSIPPASLDYWRERLSRRGIPLQGPSTRFDERVVSFLDPDGVPLELVAHAGADQRPGWRQGPVPAPHAVRGLFGVTLSEQRLQDTAALLGSALGFRSVGQEGHRHRYQVGQAGGGGVVDVLELPDTPRGEVAVGTIHHIAWRTPDDAHQGRWRQHLLALGYQVSPVRDRQYFHSIYFREPGGVLFEIATDPPGFTADEPPTALGERLRLPPWLEPQRPEIERALPALTLPAAEQEA